MPETTGSETGAWRQRAPLALLIAAVVALAYWGSLDGAFVSDDLQMVEPNPLLRSLSADNVRAIFTSFDDANYMPLKVLSLAVDQAVFGPEPFGYHLTNLALHVGCALLVFSILLAMGLSRGAACLVALLWALHPLQVESVAWISERKNVLSGFFFFAAFRAYLSFSERPRAGAYAGMLALFTLALLSKLNTLVLPAICLAYEAAWKHRYRLRDLGVVAPMFALGAVFAWYNLAFSPSHGEQFHGGSAAVTWMSSAVVVFRYLGHTLVPTGLNARYNVMLYGSPFDPPVFGAILGILALVALTIVLLKRKRKEAFWLLWFAITLSPMLNIVPFRTMMQDRYMYLALLGPIALVGTLLDSVSDVKTRRMAAAAAAALCLIYSAATVRQVRYWASPVALWVRDATLRPLRADERILRPEVYPEKLARLTDAVAQKPFDATLKTNLGALHFAAGRNQEALRHFEAARGLASDEPYNLINLGRTYTRLQRPADAERALKRATELLPYELMPCYYLLRLYIEQRDATNARATLDRCSSLYEGLRAERAQVEDLESAAR